MGETTSKTDRAARAHAAIIGIARTAAETGQTAAFWGYCLAVELWATRGGWIYPKGQSGSTAQALAHGRRAFAQKIADGRYSHIAAAMAEHYERSMPADVEPIEYAGAHAFRSGGQDWQGNVRGDLCAFEDCGTSRESPVHVTADVDPALLDVGEQDMRGTVTAEQLFGADEQLIGKCVRVVGAKAGRGLVVDVTDHGRSVHVQMTDRLVIADPINVEPLDAEESDRVREQLAAAGKLPPKLGDIVQIPTRKIGVVESLTARSEPFLVAVECGDTRGPFRASTLRHVPPAALLAVEPLWFKREALPAEYVLAAIGRCHAGNALTGRALAAYHRKQYPIALAYAVAQQIEQVRQVVHRCVNPWHGSADARTLIACPECYELHPTAEQVARPDGVVFAVGDVVTWTKGPDTQTQWRVDTLYVPRATGAGEQREPFAGMSAVVQPKYGTRGTAGRLSLLRHVGRPGVVGVGMVGWQDVDGTPTDVANALARRLVELVAPKAVDPEPEHPAPCGYPGVLPCICPAELDVDGLTERIVRRAQYDALRTMLDVLNGWASGARENHEALDHRGERPGGECWRSFDHEDIVRMVAEVAHELGTLDPTKAVASDV